MKQFNEIAKKYENIEFFSSIEEEENDNERRSTLEKQKTLESNNIYSSAYFSKEVLINHPIVAEATSDFDLEALKLKVRMTDQFFSMPYLPDRIDLYKKLRL